MPNAETPLSRGLTVSEVALRYRISPDKVRALIKANELPAINTATMRCARPRYVVLPEGLATFEKSRAAAEPPKPAPRKRRPAAVDYFP